MNFRKSLISISAGLLLYCNSYAELPNNYQAMNSEEKQTIIWQQVFKSHQSLPLPPLEQGGWWATLKKLRGLFNLSPSFDYVSDELPEGRIKILHPNGSVAKIRLNSAGGHPFTGLYQTGDIGLARLSLGAAPTDTSFIPGMAIKFLLPSKASVNIHVMNSLEGQGSNWNFFENDFSNKIEHPSSYVLRAIEKIFEWTKSPANELSIAALAKVEASGQEVNMPIAPEQIWLRPTENVRLLIDPTDRHDFRLALEKIPVGPVYELYGSLSGIEYHIGSISLESELLASEYGDNTLFFQHQR